MTKQEIEGYLRSLALALDQQGIVGEIVIFGGAAMVLAHQARVSTKDVDAVFVPKAEVYKAAKAVEESDGAPPGWLNDAVKGFVSNSETVEPLYDWPGLKVYVAAPQYLLAMKCMSMRLGPDETDLKDIRFLRAKLGLHEASEILALVQAYYPREHIPPKTQFAIQELCQDAGKA